MSKEKSEVSDLTNREDFPWRLRCMMALADIQVGELAEETGITMQTIYKARAGMSRPSKRNRERLVLTIEKWRPGTMAMIRAAESCRVKIQK